MAGWDDKIGVLILCNLYLYQLDVNKTLSS